MYMYYLLGHKLMELPYSIERKTTIADNTYLLALDGDIDFTPDGELVPQRRIPVTHPETLLISRRNLCRCDSIGSRNEIINRWVATILSFISI